MGRLWHFLKVTLIAVVTTLIVIVAVFGVWAYGQMQPRDFTAARAKWDANMSPEVADKAALDLVSKMTLDEKMAQMHGEGFARMMLSMLLHQTAAVVYAGDNERLGIPPLGFTDGPRGVICGRSTAFPVSMARAATWDTELEGRVGDVIGKEARAQGANYWGGLCINLVRHPSMGRAEESYGEDPWLMGEMAVAVLEGVQNHNVMACAKHFALNSQETARFKNDVQIDERTLREVYLPHFRKVVEHDVGSFMSAYNKVRGEWCGKNRHLLTTILREDWGFQGFVTSDWFWGVYDGPKGVHAGLDIEMPVAKHYGDNLKKLVEDGTVPEAEIDESVRRIVRTKLRFLTREDPMEYSEDLAAAPEHTALAREVAEKSMVLLKNEGPLLPLDKAATKTIAVVGHLADAENTGDRGSSNVNPPYRTSALKGIQDYLGAGATVLHADGSDLDEVARVAGEADVVLIVAGSRHDEVGEYIVADQGDDSVGGMPPADGGGRLRPDGLEEKGSIVFKLPGPGRAHGDGRGRPRAPVPQGTRHHGDRHRRQGQRALRGGARGRQRLHHRGMEGRRAGHHDGLVLRDGGRERPGPGALRRCQPQREDAPHHAEERVPAPVLRRVRGHQRVRPVPRLHPHGQGGARAHLPLRPRAELHDLRVRQPRRRHPEGRPRRSPRRHGGRDEHRRAGGRGDRPALRRLRGLEGRAAGEAPPRFRQGRPRARRDEDRPA